MQVQQHRYSDAEQADFILQKCYPVLTEILEYQIQAKEENLKTGSITAVIVELVL